MKISIPRKINTILLAVFIGALAYILLLGNNSLLARLRLQQKIRTVITDINTIKGQNKLLEEEIQRLKNDEIYIQNTARRQGFLKADEKVYRFVEEAGQTNTVNKPGIFARARQAWEYRTGRLFFLIGLLFALAGTYAVIILRRRRNKRIPVDKTGK